MSLDLTKISGGSATCQDAVGWTSGLATPPLEWALVGSAALYGSGNDVDVAALFKTRPTLPVTWTPCGKDYGDSSFTAYRRGKINILVFTDAAHYHRMIAAQRAAEYLAIQGLLPQSNRALRVALFAAVRGSV